MCHILQTFVSCTCFFHSTTSYGNKRAQGLISMYHLCRYTINIRETHPTKIGRILERLSFMVLNWEKQFRENNFDVLFCAFTPVFWSPCLAKLCWKLFTQMSHIFHIQVDDELAIFLLCCCSAQPCASHRCGGRGTNNSQNILNDLNITQPVFLTRIDGHSAWANNVAMEKSGMHINPEWIGVKYIYNYQFKFY